MIFDVIYEFYLSLFASGNDVSDFWASYVVNFYTADGALEFYVFDYVCAIATVITIICGIFALFRILGGVLRLFKV